MVGVLDATLDELIAIHTGVAVWLSLWLVGKVVVARLRADVPVLVRLAVARARAPLTEKER